MLNFNFHLSYKSNVSYKSLYEKSGVLCNDILYDFQCARIKGNIIAVGFNLFIGKHKDSSIMLGLFGYEVTLILYTIGEN